MGSRRVHLKKTRRLEEANCQGLKIQRSQDLKKQEIFELVQAPNWYVGFSQKRQSAWRVDPTDPDLKKEYTDYIGHFDHDAAYDFIVARWPDEFTARLNGSMTRAQWEAKHFPSSGEAF